MKICALIITHNREKQLLNLISALKGQTYRQFDISVYDASSDAKTEKTVKSLNKDIRYKKLEKYTRDEAYAFAIKELTEIGYNWLWLLHDDTQPNENALAGLVEGLKFTKNASFFTSAIVDENGKPLYSPVLSPFSVNGVGAWGEKLEHSLIRIGNASHISTLVNCEAIKKVGLPTKDDKICENSKYMGKLVSVYGAAYLAGKSKVIHFKQPKIPAALPKPNYEKYKVCSIVVTYNRKVMLEKCIDALLNQSYKRYDIVIVDNASTDGTKEFVDQKYGNKIIYLNTGANLGGSGGFYFGMKYAYEKGYDLFWIMDDDVVPTPNALLELLKHTSYVKNFSFLASAVYSKDNKAMNSPEISNFKTNGYRFWYDKLEYGMVRLAHATFVSLLINKEAVKKCGLPCKDYFIWGDDTEYTMRIIGKYGAAYMVGSSKVYHLRNIVSNLSIRTEKEPNRIKMYYYLVRNTLINTKAYSGEKALKNAIKRYHKDCFSIARSKESYRRLKIKTILNAINDFKKGNYNISAFENRYQVYGQEKAVVNFIGFPENCELKSEYGYVYKLLGAEFNIFTLYNNDIPAFIKESVEGWNISKNIKRDIKQLTMQFDVLKNQNEFLVIDVLGSLSDVVNCSNGKNGFNLSYTDICKEELNDGRLNYLTENYEIKKFSSYEIAIEQIDNILINFSMDLVKKCKANHIIFVKRNIESKDYKLTEFYNQIIQKLKMLIPECKIIDMVKLEKNCAGTCLEKDELIKMVKDMVNDKKWKR